MIELHYHSTPNGQKIVLMLEEAGMPYELVRCDISQGDQFKPEFLRIAPNNKMPAIIDHDTPQPISVFESGAILVYLAEKSGRFLPTDPAARAEAMQWLFWQCAGLGPMCGQVSHFRNHSDGSHGYPLERYSREVSRLYAVFDVRLRDRDFIAGDYSIADMASYAWMVDYRIMQLDIGSYPNVKAWLERVGDRPAVRRAAEVKAQYRSRPPSTFTPEEQQQLFFQDADTLRRHYAQAGLDQGR